MVRAMTAEGDIPVILLAAGHSARMRGRDKLMEEVEGMPLIRRQVRMARRVTAAPVIVALPPRPHGRYEALAGLDATLLEVPEAAEGMNASLRAGFAALPGGTKAAMLLLGDLPELTENDLNSVLQSVDLNSENLIWRGATDTLDPGHPIVFAAPLFPVFATLVGDGGGREVVAQAKGRVHLVPLPGNRARRDLDTPEDWAAWRSEQGLRRR